MNSSKFLTLKKEEKSSPAEFLQSFLRHTLQAYAGREGGDGKSCKKWELLTEVKDEKTISSADPLLNFKRDVLFMFKTLYPENPVRSEFFPKLLKDESTIRLPPLSATAAELL